MRKKGLGVIDILIHCMLSLNNYKTGRVCVMTFERNER